MSPSPSRTTGTPETDTASRILDIAERFAQTRGFNAFSYADIAAELGVAKPSLHYHFRTKALLGEALVDRYSHRFFHELDRIEDSDADQATKLTRYIALYRSVLVARRMCLCGILAAEYQTLPEGMRAAVGDFFDRNEAWLQRVLADGGPPRATQSDELQATARTIIDTLEGAVMLARARDDISRFDRSAERLLTSVLGTESASPAPTG